MRQPPLQQIHSPSLISSSAVNDGGIQAAIICLKSQEQLLTITIVQPQSLPGMYPTTESDIASLLCGNCSMLSVYPTRIEAWSHDGFLRAICGHSVSIS